MLHQAVSDDADAIGTQYVHEAAAWFERMWTSIAEDGASASEAVLVGHPTTDIEAAHAADVPVIGYANKPGKIARLKNAGADAIATDMHQLADAIRAAGVSLLFSATCFRTVHRGDPGVPVGAL